MEKRNQNSWIEHDPEGNRETIKQIMDVYASGVTDQPDGQLHLYEEENRNVLE